MGESPGRAALPEYIPPIIWNIGFHQKSQELLFKVAPSMMLCLIAIYIFTAGICDGLTLKAPNPSCQANLLSLSLIQREEFAFRSRRASESIFVASKTRRMCT